MFSLKVKNRDYLKIFIKLGIIWVGGVFVSFFLYDAIINRIIYWVNDI